MIASPAPNKEQAKHSATGKVKTSAMKSIEAEAETIGLPYLKARETIRIENIGKKFSGSWRITKVRHEISNSGYTCSLSLSKNDHEGNSSKKNSGNVPKTSTKNNSQAQSAGNVKQKGSTKPATVKVNLN